MSEGGRARLDRFIAEMQAEFPSFRIVKKSESGFSRLIDRLLRIITLGGQREYLTRYYTVIGSTLYVPPSFDDADPLDILVTLHHERVHLRQRRRLTMPGMTLVYLLLPLPLGLAYGRARLEWEAYTETLRATYEIFGEEALRAEPLRRRIVGQFTSAAYGWMWPFESAVNAWYDQAIADILRQR